MKTLTLTLSDGCQLHVRDLGGRGPDLVAVHGIPEDSSSFHPIEAGLASSNRLVLPDLRGFGRSIAGGREAATLGRMADDLAEMVRVMELKNPVFLGHDIGGYVVMDYAQRSLGPMRAMVLMNTTYGKLYVSGSLHLVVFCVPVVGPLFCRLLGHRLADLAFHLGFVDQERVDPAHRERIRKMAARPETRRALASIYASIGMKRLTKTFRRPPPPRPIELPSRIIWGEKDWFLDVRLIDWLRGLLPRADVVHLPGVGHFPQQEAPAETLAAVLDFLKQLDGTSME